jgi:hemerythrin-like domain-containing protein
MSTPVSPRARPARPARAPAPALPPFEALDRTHHRVIEMLGQFERLLAHVDENGADDTARASAAEIFAFFEGNARQHHLDEERHVFPSLLSGGAADLVDTVRRLQQDHGWLEEDWLELAPQIEAIAKGYNWWDLAMLRLALPVFTALYHEHIAVEESLIYPEAKRRQAALEAGTRARGA